MRRSSLASVCLTSTLLACNLQSPPPTNGTPSNGNLERSSTAGSQRAVEGIEPEVGVSQPPAEESAVLPERLIGEPLIVAGDVVAPVKVSGDHIPYGSPDCPRPQGVILVRGVVDIEGHLGEIEFLRELGPTCSEAAVRKALETWRFKPARLHGEPVAVYYNMTSSVHPQ